MKHKAGGVYVYARNDIICECFSCDIQCDKIEMLWPKCCFNHQCYYIACCSLLIASTSRMFFLEALTKSIDVILASGSSSDDELLIIEGDFNTLNWDTVENQW